LLADRSLSRLLKEDWPKSLEELEDRKAQRVTQSPATPSANSPRTASVPGIAPGIAPGKPRRARVARDAAAPSSPPSEIARPDTPAARKLGKKTRGA
jgi:hypothetical protein